ncbi:surface antigen (D15), partial [mine drainage metagenome]
MLPTILHTDAAGQITRIIAPDINYNPDFGAGIDGRIFEYPSPNTRWHIEGGLSQRVASWFNAKFETGLLRESRWSWNVQIKYNRSGTPRFYGIGNDSPQSNRSVYTRQQLGVTGTLGWNITHAWQLAYTLAANKVKVGAGTLPGIPSMTIRFPGERGIGTTHELLNRVALIYDTRNDITIPTRGVDIVLYGGVANRGFRL